MAGVELYFHGINDCFDLFFFADHQQKHFGEETYLLVFFRFIFKRPLLDPGAECLECRDAAYAEFFQAVDDSGALVLCGNDFNTY